MYLKLNAKLQVQIEDDSAIFVPCRPNGLMISILEQVMCKGKPFVEGFTDGVTEIIMR